MRHTFWIDPRVYARVYAHVYNFRTRFEVERKINNTRALCVGNDIVTLSRLMSFSFPPITGISRPLINDEGKHPGTDARGFKQPRKPRISSKNNFKRFRRRRKTRRNYRVAFARYALVHDCNEGPFVINFKRFRNGVSQEIAL